MKVLRHLARFLMHKDVAGLWIVGLLLFYCVLCACTNLFPFWVDIIIWIPFTAACASALVVLLIVLGWEVAKRWQETSDKKGNGE